MTADSDAGTEQFEKIAREALNDQVEADFEEMVEQNAYAVHNSLLSGENAGESVRRATYKFTEYIDCALFEFQKLGDLDRSGPTVRLVETGGGLAADLAKVAKRLEVPAEQRAAATWGRSDDTLRPGTPEHAARSLLRAWRELDDVAREAGEALPEDLRPPENTEGE